MEYLLSILFIAAFIVNAFLVTYILVKSARSLLHISCAALLGCFCLWAFAMIFAENPLATKEIVSLFYNISSIGWISFSAIFLLFALTFAGKKIDGKDFDHKTGKYMSPSKNRGQAEKSRLKGSKRKKKK